MRLTLLTLTAAASLIGAAALAQTPAPGTDRNGGPTATAGSSAQGNGPTAQDAKALTPKMSKKKMMMKPKMAPKASSEALPNGTGGTTTPSGR